MTGKIKDVPNPDTNYKTIRILQKKLSDFQIIFIRNEKIQNKLKKNSIFSFYNIKLKLKKNNKFNKKE